VLAATARGPWFSMQPGKRPGLARVYATTNRSRHRLERRGSIARSIKAIIIQNFLCALAFFWRLFSFLSILACAYA